MEIASVKILAAEFERKKVGISKIFALQCINIYCVINNSYDDLNRVMYLIYGDNKKFRCSTLIFIIFRAIVRTY